MKASKTKRQQPELDADQQALTMHPRKLNRSQEIAIPNCNRKAGKETSPQEKEEDQFYIGSYHRPKNFSLFKLDLKHSKFKDQYLTCSVQQENNIEEKRPLSISR